MSDAAASQIAALEATLADQAGQIEAMQQELDETNRGVVALYAELDTQAPQLQPRRRHSFSIPRSCMRKRRPPIASRSRRRRERSS